MNFLTEFEKVKKNIEKKKLLKLDLYQNSISDYFWNLNFSQRVANFKQLRFRFWFLEHFRSEKRLRFSSQVINNSTNYYVLFVYNYYYLIGFSQWSDFFYFFVWFENCSHLFVDIWLFGFFFKIFFSFFLFAGFSLFQKHWAQNYNEDWLSRVTCFTQVQLYLVY